MAHVPISSITTPECDCRPAPDCITIINSGDTAPALALGILTVGDLVINYSDITGTADDCAAAAVAQVNTLAPSSFTVGDCCGTSDEYILQISMVQCESIVTSRYTVDVTEDSTAAEIVDSFVAQINADVAAFVTAADTGSTFTITADTAGCGFSVDFVSSNLVNIATTPNVASWGSHADIIADGGDADELADGVVYHSIDIIYRSFKFNPVAGCEKCLIPCETVCRIYFADNAGGETLFGNLVDILDGTDTASKYLAKITAGTTCA